MLRDSPEQLASLRLLNISDYSGLSCQGVFMDPYTDEDLDDDLLLWRPLGMTSENLKGTRVWYHSGVCLRSSPSFQVITLQVYQLRCA